MKIWRLLPAAILVCAACAVQAGTLTIANPSFETDVLGCAAGATCATDDSITDWTGSTADPLGFGDPGGVRATGAFGVFKPGTVQYPSGVPDGVNIAYLTAVVNSVSISQTLSATLLANDTYTLTAWAGLRDDPSVFGPGLGCNGANMSLEAGGTVLNSLVEEGSNICNVTLGDFQEFTVTFDSAGVNSALLGQDLSIVLTANGSGSIFEPAEVDFDDLSLTDTSQGSPVTTTPEPSTLLLLCSGLLGLAGMARRKIGVRA